MAFSFKSIFHTILDHVKQFFSQPQTLANEAHSASVAVKVVAPGLVLALESAGIDNPDVAKVSTEVSTDLDTLAATLDDIATNGATQSKVDQVMSIINGIKPQISSILDMVHIKNVDLRTKITNAYQAFAAEASVIAQEFAGYNPPTTTASAE